MQLWKRIWCWLAGHDWVQLLSDPDRTAARAHLHTMAGTMGYCARCGFMWDDLPALHARAREPEAPDAGPYRTPAPLPRCRCSGGQVHPDCPRHFETGRPQKPRPRPRPAVPASRTVFVKRVRIERNGKVIKDETTTSGDFAGFERTMKSFGRTMDEFARDLDRAFGRDDEDTN